MNAPRSPRISARLLLLGALLGVAACQSQPAQRAQSAQAAPAAQPAQSAPAASANKQAQVSAEISATAQVVAMIRDERLLTLRSEDGRLLDVQVGPEVRNYDQIAVGDSLRVRYKQTLAASLRPAGEAPVRDSGSLTAARAKRGEKPGAGLGVTVSLRVKIESIDAPRNIVVFSLSTGELIAHRIATDEGRAFVQGLKVGDTVQLDYAEAIALSVEKVAQPG